MEDLSIALVSDFYLPDLGGVELQIKELATYLKKRTKKVTVITHCRPEHYGVMQIEGVKTYYLAWAYSSTGAIYPTLFMQYPEARQILTDEKIDIVHVHQSSSTLGSSYAIYAYHLGLKVVHTEHSLFSVRSNTYLHFSWVIATTYRLYSKFICVSRAVRNNLALRSYTSSKKMVVIPNAVITPSVLRKKQARSDKIRIVIVGRLVYRRGVDLLLQILPIFCERNKNEAYVLQIIGDGPKMKTLNIVIDKHQLNDKIILHGGLPNDATLEIVKQCDIFLSTALTESFGIALVEAAHLGLHCISTNVGGVSEILPPNRLHIVDVTPNSIIMKLEQLMHRIKISPEESFEQKEQFYYSKTDCFERVMEVYSQVSLTPIQSQKYPILKDIFIKGSLVAVLLVIIFGILYFFDAIHKAKTILSKKLSLS